MDYRQRMLRLMGGEQGPPVFAPRMDLWAIANEARGTMPARYAGLSTAELADALGVACHAVRADYTQPRTPKELVLRGLGFDNHPDYPFRVDADGDVAIEFGPPESESQGAATVQASPEGASHTMVRISDGTNRGDTVVSFGLQQTPAMAAAGVSLPFVTKYPIETAADLDAVATLFEHLKVTATPDAYRQFHDRVGGRGVAVANGCVAASPMHLLLHDLTPMDQFFYLYHDEPAALQAFCRRLEPFFEAMLDAVAKSDAEVVLFGGNYDRNLTWPPFFEAHIVPWLRRAAEKLSAAGKLLLCHTDGENAGLCGLYRDSGFAVAESVCPAPMTSMTFGELQAALGPDICLYGGVPSVVLLADSFDDEAFRSWLSGFAADLEGRTPESAAVIVGVSDNVPPDAELDRLFRIRDAVAAIR